MSLVDSIMSLFKNPWFYGVILALAVVAYGTIRTFFRKIPIINKRSNLIVITIIGLLATSGILGSWGVGSVAANQAGWTISDVQITALSASVAGGTVALDTNNQFLINARFTDAQANETTGIYEVNSSQFFITRTGKLNADSCLIKVSSPDFTIDETTGNVGSTPFNILEKDATGRFKTYFKSGATQATTSDSQGQISIAFAEGASTATFTMLANVDEESHDALNQYSFRDVNVDVCGSPATLRIFRM